MLRLFRTSTDIMNAGEYGSRIVHLLNDQHMVSYTLRNCVSYLNLILLLQGVVTSAISFIEALSKKWPEEYKGCVSLAVSRLSRVSQSVTKRAITNEIFRF